MKQTVDPQFCCLNCKTVIGPVWDDDKNRCGCDVYEFEVVRMVPEERIVEAVNKMERLMDVVDSALVGSVHDIICLLKAGRG